MKVVTNVLSDKQLSMNGVMQLVYFKVDDVFLWKKKTKNKFKYASATVLILEDLFRPVLP